jgi:magnesium transporter
LSQCPSGVRAGNGPAFEGGGSGNYRGVVARTRCYRAGVLTDEDFAVADVSEHLDEPETVVWVHLCAPDRDDLGLVADELGLHELAVEDAVNPRQRPKLDRYPHHAFLSTYAVSFEPDSGELVTSEVGAFLTPRALVTVCKDDTFDIEAVVARWDSSVDLAKHGVAFLVHGLLDYVVDGHFDAVQSLDEAIEALEDDLFVPSADQETLQRRSFELRKSLVLLRRVVLPMREVVNTLLRRDLHLVDEAMGPYFQDVYDHVLRATEWTESLRDLVTSVLETNLTIQGNRLNVITKKVTSWAAIIAVPTAITGFYGQNVPYPGFGKPAGLYASTVLIVGLSVLLYWLFKRNDWL